MDRAFFFPVFIARPENNAKNSAPQSVNYCVTDFRRTSGTPSNLFPVVCVLQHCFFCIISYLCFKRGKSSKILLQARLHQLSDVLASLYFRIRII